MSIRNSQAPFTFYNAKDYDLSIVNSALWAAAGDALGWMTELSHGLSGVKHRTGSRTVNEPVAWKRLIGGRSGVTVDLPAGSYSDDTQLRLCVSRSIRANGGFDVEAFAKVEVTTWQGYCLGAGIGSKAAAANLSKRGVNWFSNFFTTNRQRYVTAGGNGAAMRIQPHVWSARGTRDEMVIRVMRDAVVTHGHPHGFCGAIFHALCVWDALSTREVPTIQAAKGYISYIANLPSILDKDSELSSFWRPTWEREAGKSLDAAIQQFQEEAQKDILLIENLFKDADKPEYHDVLNVLQCLTDKYRGSGFKTSLAALALSLLYSSRRIEEALVHSANELESDTDTIATMAGAILGGLVRQEPNWIIQDADYIRSEAMRMAKIARKEDVSSFSYPNVSSWEPPANQSDAVVRWHGALALAGIGKLEPKGQEYQSGSAIWQWFELPFGQSVLAKRRANINQEAGKNQMPNTQSVARPHSKLENVKRDQESFEFLEKGRRDNELLKHESRLALNLPDRFPGLDRATDIVIASGFDDTVIGHMINLAIDETGGIETPISLSAIIAKARLARMRKR